MKTTVHEVGNNVPIVYEDGCPAVDPEVGEVSILDGDNGVRIVYRLDEISKLEFEP